MVVNWKVVKQVSANQVKVFPLVVQDPASHDYFRFPRNKNGDGGALPLSSGSFGVCRPHLQDGCHQGEYIKKKDTQFRKGGMGRHLTPHKFSILKLKSPNSSVELRFQNLIFPLQWTLWTSPGPGLAATIDVRYIFKDNWLSLTTLLWKVPVEEELDGWEVEVKFNKNFSKINFFNGLSEVRTGR